MNDNFVIIPFHHNDHSAENAKEDKQPEVKLGFPEDGEGEEGSGKTHS